MALTDYILRYNTKVNGVRHLKMETVTLESTDPDTVTLLAKNKIFLAADLVGVQSGDISDGAVITSKIADSAVTSVKIANGTVADADLAGSIAQAKITNLTSDLSGKIPASTVDAKGDLLAGTADDTVARLPVGTNTYVLTADSTQSTGLRWAAVDSLPPQTSNSGKFLTTNGTSASWGTVSAGLSTADLFMMMGA